MLSDNPSANPPRNYLGAILGRADAPRGSADGADHEFLPLALCRIRVSSDVQNCTLLDTLETEAPGNALNMAGTLVA